MKILCFNPQQELALLAFVSILNDALFITGECIYQNLYLYRTPLYLQKNFPSKNIPNGIFSIFGPGNEGWWNENAAL
jgi:hypothetical protein